MSKKEKTANLEVLIECEVRDKNGKILSVHRQKSKSLLKNFAKMLRTMLYPSLPTAPSTNTVAVTTSLYDTSGASKSFYASLVGWSPGTSYYFGLYPLCAGAPAGNDAYGIQVGTGTGAVTRDDYQLVYKILNGTGSGQLSYGAMTVEDTDGTPPDTVFRLIRTFTNNTSSSITVYEIGLVIANVYVPWGSSFSPTTSYFLIARDLLSTPQTIPAGATLTVRYIFKVTA
jgi:hypothetical protein